MALLPGIDPRNRTPNPRSRTARQTAGIVPSTPAPTPVVPQARTSTDPIPGLPKSASQINLGIPTYGTWQYGTITPYPNPNAPLNQNGQPPPQLYGPNNNPLTYNNEPLWRNEGPFVGVGPDTGVAMFNANGKLQFGKTFGNLRNTWENFDAYKTAAPELIQAVQAKLLAAGLLSKGSFISGSYDAATQSAMYVAMREGNMAGQSWLKYTEQQAAAVQSGSRKMQVGDSTTQTSYSYTTRETALGLVKQAIQQDLGRDPTDGEVGQFLRELRAEEKANPVVTTTTLTSEQGDTSVTSEGGVDQQAWSEDYGERIKPKKSQRYKEAVYENMLISMISDGSL